MVVVVGARVRYTRRFLKSILEPPTGPAWHQRGTVVAVSRFVSVKWDGDDEPRGASAEVLEPALGCGFYIDDSSEVELAYERIFGLNGYNSQKGLD